MHISTSLRDICVVGNIASGKSTLTELLAQAIPSSVAVPEDFTQNPFLESSLNDPPRWAFTNAVRYFYDYARVYQTMTQGQTYAHHFIDAGAATNRFIYGRYMFDQGWVTPAEYELYEILCDVITRVYAYPDPDAYIFLDVTPQVCFQRMQARMTSKSWQYQRPISPDYLAKLTAYFDRFRAELETQRVPVLVLKRDTDDLMTPEGNAAIVAQVRAFLQKHSQDTQAT